MVFFVIGFIKDKKLIEIDFLGKKFNPFGFVEILKIRIQDN